MLVECAAFVAQSVWGQGRKGSDSSRQPRLLVVPRGWCTGAGIAWRMGLARKLCSRGALFTA